jgi:hypothetical protein
MRAAVVLVAMSLLTAALTVTRVTAPMMPPVREVLA